MAVCTANDMPQSTPNPRHSQMLGERVPFVARLFVGGCNVSADLIAGVRAAPRRPLNRLGPPNSALVSAAAIAISTPRTASTSPAARATFIGWRGLSSQPNWSMSRPIVICPSTGISTVCRLPSLGSSRMFPVMKITPNSPANHIHHGPRSADSGTSGYGPSTSAAMVVAVSPTVNETSEALNGVPTAVRRRALMAVCAGVITPVSTPNTSNVMIPPFRAHSILTFSASALAAIPRAGDGRIGLRGSCARLCRDVCF